jgi:hypothetical protein
VKVQLWLPLENPEPWTILVEIALVGLTFIVVVYASGTTGTLSAFTPVVPQFVPVKVRVADCGGVMPEFTETP